MANKNMNITVALRDLASRGLKSIADTTGNIVGNFEKAKQASQKFALALGTLGAGAGFLGKQILGVSADFEQARISFTTMTGSVEAADKLIRDMFEFAKTTPFELQGLQTATQRLLAYGFTQDNVLSELRVLGDIASGVGTEKLPQLILAYGQVKAATRLTGMELRQFTETGVPMIDALAEHFGVASSEIQDMVSDGVVGFADVQAALKKLTGEGGKFENLMEKQTGTLNQMVSNLKDSFTQLAKEQGDKLLEPAKRFVGLLQDFVTNKLPSILNGLENMVKFLRENKLVMVAIAGAITGMLIPAFVALATAVASGAVALAPYMALGAAFAAIAFQMSRVSEESKNLSAQLEVMLANGQKAQKGMNLLLREQQGELSKVLDLEQRKTVALNKVIQLQKERNESNLLWGAITGRNKEQIEKLNEAQEAYNDLVREGMRNQQDMSDVEKRVARDSERLAMLRVDLGRAAFEEQLTIIKSLGEENQSLQEMIISGEVQMTQEKVRLIKAFGITSEKIFRKISDIDANTARDRLKIAQDLSLNRIDLQEQLLGFQATATKKEVEIFAAGLKRKQAVMVKFDQNLRELLKPKIQKIGLAIEDATQGGVIGGINTAMKILSDPNSIRPAIQELTSGFSELSVSFEEEMAKIDQETEESLNELTRLGDGIKNDMEDTAKGGSGAVKDSFAEIEKKAEEMREKIGDAQKSIQDKQLDYAESVRNSKKEVDDLIKKHEEARDRIIQSMEAVRNRINELEQKEHDLGEERNQSLAKLVVQQEEAIAKMKQSAAAQREELRKLNDELAKEEDDRKDRIRERISEEQRELQEIEAKLAKETAALSENADLQKQLEDEINQIRAFNALTEFEQRKQQLEEEFVQKSDAIKAEIEQEREKLKKLQEQLEETEKLHAEHLARIQEQRAKDFLKFKADIEQRIQLLNRLIAAQNEAFGTNKSIPSQVDVQNIPAFGDGGIVTRPTIAAIAERGQPEAVIPLKDGMVPVKVEGGMGGETTIVINNPIIRNESDIQKLGDELEARLARKFELNRQGVAQ